MEIIDDIVKRGKVPIIIGGTHYYTETLIFK
jgi:tRNA A37 N6-isopentenylltransferase MiaA